MAEEGNSVLLGYRKNGSPIYLAQGGAPDEEPENESELLGYKDNGDPIYKSDDDDEDEIEDDDEESTKPAAKKAPAKAPPKSGYDSALSRERAARKTAERQLRELRRKNESDAERLAREADEFASAKYKPAAIRASAKAALTEARIKGDAAKAVRLISLDDLEIDDDGEIIGLDDQIIQLKTDYPDLFEQPAKRRVVAKVDGAGKKAPNNEPKTSAEKIAAMYGVS